MKHTSKFCTACRKTHPMSEFFEWARGKPKFCKTCMGKYSKTERKNLELKFVMEALQGIKQEIS